MPSTETRLTFPTEADYNVVDRAIGEAHGQAESLVYQLEKIAKANDEAPDDDTIVPTLVDVGLLASFRQGLEHDAAFLADLVGKTDELARTLNLDRLDKMVRSGRDA